MARLHIEFGTCDFEAGVQIRVDWDLHCDAEQVEHGALLIRRSQCGLDLPALQAYGRPAMREP